MLNVLDTRGWLSSRRTIFNRWLLAYKRLYLHTCREIKHNHNCMKRDMRARMLVISPLVKHLLLKQEACGQTPPQSRIPRKARGFGFAVCHIGGT